MAVDGAYSGITTEGVIDWFSLLLVAFYLSLLRLRSVDSGAIFGFTCDLIASLFHSHLQAVEVV